MDYGVCCEILTPRSVRSLNQYDFLNNLNKDDNKRHGNLDGVKLGRHQPCTKNYRQPRSAKSRRNSLPEWRTHQLVIKDQRAIPENMHASNIIWIVKVVLMNTHTHTNVKAINEKESIKLKESKVRGM